MSDNLLGPPCRNPWKLDRTSGGSSGGAAASVAAGLGPLALGSDGAGSIRIPAALCGVFGLKPSFGRIPFHRPRGNNYFAATSHNGPITRTVRDAALMLTVMAGPDPRDPLAIDEPSQDYVAACDGELGGLRIAWSPDLGYGAVDPEVKTITERAALRFVEIGCSAELADVHWPNPRDFRKIIWEVGIASCCIDHVQQLPGVGDGQRDQAPLLEQQQVCLGQPGEHPRVGAIRFRDPEVGQERRDAIVPGRTALPAGRIAQGAGKVRLANAGRTGHRLLTF
jgi:Asp-tRNA(Asn)/Glu-tRNA(Gln) amidotransferase A subunit family amidase